MCLFGNNRELVASGASGKEPACQCREARDVGLIPGREDPLEEGTATHSSVLPGESHGQRSLEGCSLWGHKESDSPRNWIAGSYGASVVCVCVCGLGGIWDLSSLARD